MTEKYQIDFYIPCAKFTGYLLKAIESVLTQVETDRYRLNLIIINNSGKPFTDWEVPDYPSGMIYTVYNTPVRFTFAQIANYIALRTIEKGTPLFMSMHDDAAIKPGAIDDLLDRYEEVKDEKWLMIRLADNYDICSIGNPQFYKQENVWWDTFLFSMYFVDIHFFHMAEIRGWKVFHSKTPNLLEHFGSISIRKDDIMNERNRINSKYTAEVYKDIWGGYPGQETTDKCDILGQ